MNGWLFAVLICVAAPVLAAPPVEAFFGNSAIASATLSPKGHYVALLQRGLKGGQLVIVLDTRDLSKFTIAGTANNDYGVIASVHWINENRIGFTVKNLRGEFEGNMDEFAADRNGANTEHLIAGNWRHRQEKTGSNIQSKVLTAAYAYYGPTHDGSDDIIVEKYSWNNIDRAPESSRLYRLDTRTRKLSDLLPGTQPARIHRWILDTDSQPRIAVSSHKGRCTVFYRDRDAATWSELDDSDCIGDTRLEPLFFDSRNTLYVAGGYRGHDALYTYDVTKRERAKEPLVAVDGFDFRGRPELDFAAKTVVGLHFGSDARSTLWFDPSMKAAQQQVDALLPGMINRISCGHDCRTATALLITSTSDRQPVQYFVYTPATGDIAGLGGQHPAIRPADMGERDFHRYAARDGMRIPVYVTLPPGNAKGPHPTVVLVHGGPYLRGHSWEWDSEAQFLASRGYVVLQPEFRGSTGYGFRHFQAGWKQWGRTMQDDLADAAQWAVAQGWSDPRRIAIMGGSYGGYATLMGLIRHPGIFRCGIDYAGPSDIGMMFSVTQSDASQEALKYGMKALLGDPETDAVALAEVSPLAQAARLTRPVLIGHGAMDRRVPMVHASAMRSALKHNNAVEYVVYADEGHSLGRLNNRLDFYQRVEAFLAKHLQ